MNKILEIKFGSHLYGTDTENSDLDLKGIYIPEARDIILGRITPTISTSRTKQPFERNSKDDIDIEIVSLGQFLKLLLEGQTMALDMLFAPDWSYTFTGKDICLFQEIYANRLRLMNRRLNSFVGYARQQASKYGQKGFRIHAYRAALDWLKSHPNEHERIETVGIDAIKKWIESVGNEHIKLAEKGVAEKFIWHIEVCGKYIPFTNTFKHTKSWLQKYFDEYGQRALLAEQNQGVDWKALSHAVRVNSEAQEVLETGFITFPRPDRKLLLKIKTGQIPFKDVSEIIDEGLAQLKRSEEISILPDEPDRQWADDFLFDVYRDAALTRISEIGGKAK